MKLVKTANGKTAVKMSQKEWEDLGKKAGWMKVEAEKDEDGWPDKLKKGRFTEYCKKLSVARYHSTTRAI